MDYSSGINKLCTLTIWDSMDGPGEYYAKRTMSGRERQTLCNVPYM